MKILNLLVILSLMLVGSPVSARCIERASSERLEVLRVESCLWATSKKKPIAIELRETLTNIGKTDIVLELHRSPILRYRVDISLDGVSKSIEPPAPVLHNPNDPWAVGRESLPLAPGKSITLSVPFAELMADPPVSKAKYRIAINHNYPWRRPDEPAGQGFRLRLEESNLKKSFPETKVFEGVRLK